MSGSPVFRPPCPHSNAAIHHHKGHPLLDIELVHLSILVSSQEPFGSPFVRSQCRTLSVHLIVSASLLDAGHGGSASPCQRNIQSHTVAPWAAISAVALRSVSRFHADICIGALRMSLHCAGLPARLPSRGASPSQRNTQPYCLAPGLLPTVAYAGWKDGHDTWHQPSGPHSPGQCTHTSEYCNLLRFTRTGAAVMATPAEV